MRRSGRAVPDRRRLPGRAAPGRRRRAPAGVNRIPLRVKLTLAFTGVMAVLLAGAGIALSVLVAQNLDSTIDDGLLARAGDASAVIAGGEPLAGTKEPFAQLLTLDGRVRDTTTGAGTAPLMGPGATA